VFRFHGSEGYGLNIAATDSAGGAVAEELNEYAATALSDVFSLLYAANRSGCGSYTKGLGKGEFCVADGDGGGAFMACGC